MAEKLSLISVVGMSQEELQAVGWTPGVQHVRGPFIYVIHSFIHLFILYLLNDCCVTGIVLGTGDLGMDLTFCLVI